MKVKELIEVLDRLPPEMLVVQFTHSDITLDEVTGIELILLQPNTRWKDKDGNRRFGEFRDVLEGIDNVENPIKAVRIV